MACKRNPGQQNIFAHLMGHPVFIIPTRATTSKPKTGSSGALLVPFVTSSSLEPGVFCPPARPSIPSPHIHEVIVTHIIMYAWRKKETVDKGSLPYKICGLYYPLCLPNLNCLRNNWGNFLTPLQPSVRTSLRDSPLAVAKWKRVLFRTLWIPKASAKIVPS